jgi:hypothetical protein
MLVGFVAFFAGAAANSAEVVLTKGETTVKAAIDGEGFLAYQFATGRKKPFFLPVAAPGGFEDLKTRLTEPGNNQDLVLNSVFVIQEGAVVRSEPRSRDAKDRLNFGELLVAGKVEDGVVHIPAKNGWVSFADVVPIASTITRLISDDIPPTKLNKMDARYYDHPHHKGIWFSIDEVNGLKHWAEGHKIVNKSVELVTPKGETAVMKLVNHWVNEKDEPVLEETTTVRIHSSRLIDYDAQLKAVGQPVTFGHTKEGMFGVRVPNSMREFMEQGKVISEEGVQTTKKLWGQPAKWIDYQGKVGNTMFGVTVMDHPDNFRPSRYHVRDYGLFAISPFGDPEYSGGKVQTPEHELKAGESVRLRYAAYPHRGDEKEGKVAEAFQTFATAK